MPAKHIVYKGRNLRLGKTEILRLIEHMVSLDQNNQGVNEMKQYKVGDTIYLKALVAKVDKNDPEKTYGVNFVHKNYGVQVWPEREAIVDELPTAKPVKPNYQILTGTELIETAMDDWKDYSDDDKSLFDWYPQLNTVLPLKKYKVWPELQFEEVEE